MSYNELYALVAEVEANHARVKQARAEAERTPVRQLIDGGFGSVTVSGEGELLAVDLNRAAIAGLSNTSVAPAVLRAITEAEERAAAQFTELIAAARRDVQTPEIQGGPL
jgi:DNA-binding protein YbaB